MYAILSDRGKQYRVKAGELLQVDLRKGDKGEEVVFDQVLLVGEDGGQVKVGSPTVAGARVTGVFEESIKGDKTISHHRVRTNSLGRRRGHRTKYSVIRIQTIEG